MHALAADLGSAPREGVPPSQTLLSVTARLLPTTAGLLPTTAGLPPTTAELPTTLTHLGVRLREVVQALVGLGDHRLGPGGPGGGVGKHT